MIDPVSQFRKWMILIHRYLGIALSPMFVVWFASGIAMMCARGMPGLTPPGTARAFAFAGSGSSRDDTRGSGGESRIRYRPGSGCAGDGLGPPGISIHR